MRRAVTVGPRKIVIEEVPDPVPGADEAVVRVEAVGLCGTDYHVFLGHLLYATYPVTQGHELAGVVELVGAGYSGPVRVGERVAVDPMVPCRRCFACRRGRSSGCASLRSIGMNMAGGLAERVVVPASALYGAGDLDVETAAFVEPVAVGLESVVRAGIGVGDTVVVLGAGPIGQAVLLGATDRGGRVLIADRIPLRLEFAEQLGAERVVDTRTMDLSREARAWTSGEGPAAVIDASGAPELIRLGFDMVAPTGAIVIVGVSEADLVVPVRTFVRKGVNVLGSRGSNGMFADAMDLVRRKAQVVRTLVTHRYQLSSTLAAFQFAVEHPEEIEKIVVRTDNAFAQA